MKKIAVIDCGSNTFHLMIVNIVGNSYNIVHRNRQFIHLSEDGVESLSESAQLRAMNCLLEFKEEMKHFDVEMYKCVGTAALRKASNASNFIAKVKSELDIDIAVIQGEEEARLIHLGVKSFLPADIGNYVIMDIGGGSTEFIVDHSNETWERSFELGVSLLYNKFQHQDPISIEEILQIDQFLAEELSPLLKVLNTLDSYILVGAAGTFDVVKGMAKNSQKRSESGLLSKELFMEIYNKVIPLSLNQRLSLREIPSYRAPMIIVALVLIKFIFNQDFITKLLIVDGDIKDGILLDLMSKH